jgi:hypothetical protein
MLTKLTKAVLENEKEWKVSFPPIVAPVSVNKWLGKRTWEAQTPMGRVSWLLIKQNLH